MEEGGEEEEDEVARPPRRRRPGRFALCCQMRGIYQILLLHEILTKFFELVRACFDWARQFRITKSILYRNCRMFSGNLVLKSLMEVAIAVVERQAKWIVRTMDG